MGKIRPGLNLGIRTKIAGAYLLIIAGILFGINWFVLRTLEGNYLHDRGVRALASANTIALAGQDVILRHDRSTYYFVRNFGDQLQARVLVVDETGRVTVDSFSETWLEGRVLAHDELVSALAGTGKTGAHELQSGEKVLYAAVPVGDSKPFPGAVMLVISLADVYAVLGDIRRLVLAVSAGGGLIAMAAGLFLAARLTRPIHSLTNAARMMAQGRLNQRVKIESNDEIGRLARTFNEMAVELEKADRTRRQFLTDASHELKTPLSSIKVLAQSLLESGEQNTAVYRDFLRDIDTEIDRLNRLVDHMFQLTKLEDADYPVRCTVQELGPLLSHIKGLLLGQAEQKGITLEIYPETGEGLCWTVNRDLFIRIILNLLDNALRYTPAGGKVEVRAVIKNEELVLKVADTGTGIPPEALSHIFDRFYRQDLARARETGGTGLGLAIVRHAVFRHGGSITVNSRVGKGTTFEIRFPRNSRQETGHCNIIVI